MFRRKPLEQKPSLEPLGSVTQDLEEGNSLTIAREDGTAFASWPVKMSSQEFIHRYFSIMPTDNNQQGEIFLRHPEHRKATVEEIADIVLSQAVPDNIRLLRLEYDGPSRAMSWESSYHAYHRHTKLLGVTFSVGDYELLDDLLQSTMPLGIGEQAVKAARLMLD